jgi:MoaA/NifB/PqqE/SkfB family radical SAM enzyme
MNAGTTAFARRILNRLTPLHLDWIQVEVSARCQGQCLYCPVAVLRGKRENGLMAMETFEALLPAFPTADLVFLQGWGEPLLHPGFWEMAARAAATGAQVGFTTNGRLLHEENRRALLDSGVAILGVTLAGANSETHDRYRPGSPLKALDCSLRRLKKEKQGMGAGQPHLHIAYQLLPGNVAELKEAVSLARAWGASQIVVSPLSLVLAPKLERESLHAQSGLWAVATDCLEEARGRARGEGIALHAYRVTGPEPQAACPENVLRSCFVSVRGDVSPCVMTNLGLERAGEVTHRFQGEDHPLRTVTFGNVQERPLRDIWHSDSARTFRGAIRKRIYEGRRGREGLPTPCRHCYKLFQA